MWTNNDTTSSTNDNDNDEDQMSPFHIQVSARFKPKDEHDETAALGKGGVDSEKHYAKKIALPLHQRLALIQMDRNLESRKEAFQVLFQQGGWFGDMRDTTTTSTMSDEDIIMSDDKNYNETKNQENTLEKTEPVALRPPTLRGGVHLIDSKNNFAVLVDTTKGLRKFDFDNVIDECTTQEAAYRSTAMGLIADFINGYNISCIVYGQTGSGKTFTMFGNDEFHLNHDDLKIPSSWGVVPRSCFEIFKAIEYRKNNLELKFETEIAVSYIEIFGDSVTDLLREGRSCGQSKVAAQRYVLDGSSEVVSTSLAHTLCLLNQGEKQKRKAATAMNERSSRAHSIFIVRMKQTCTTTGVTYTNRLFLADLGGSEQLKKSQPLNNSNSDSDTREQEYDRKQRTREAVNINLGLLALKQCVEALRKKSSFVPYTDSKLTMMLSTGLGGNSKTAIIVCGAQEARHGAETIAAMKFGQICRGISNKSAGKTTTVMLQELLQNINGRIAECEENIKKYERWQVKEVLRPIGDDGKEMEVRKVTAVVGAEEYRELLSTLIRRKLELTGDSVETLYSNSSTVEGFGNAHIYGLGKKVGLV